MSRLPLRWRMDLRLTSLAALLLPVLLLLGCWQLQRADEKAAEQAAFDERRHLSPVGMSAAGGALPSYTPVRLTGTYDNAHTFLLDNRMVGGRYGFEVVVPFETVQGDRVLVNRGWMAADPARRSLPAIPPVKGRVTVIGQVFHEHGGMRWVDNMTDRSWPQVVQYVAPVELAERLGRQLQPFVVRIDEGAPGALTVDWPVINSRPEMHIGYAVQWFGLAATLLLAWLLASTNLWQLIRGKPHRGD